MPNCQPTEERECVDQFGYMHHCGWQSFPLIIRSTTGFYTKKWPYSDTLFWSGNLFLATLITADRTEEFYSHVGISGIMSSVSQSVGIGIWFVSHFTVLPVSFLSKVTAPPVSPRSQMAWNGSLSTPPTRKVIKLTWPNPRNVRYAALEIQLLFKYAVNLHT